MKRYVIIGVIGVLVLVAAIALNFLLTGGPGDSPMVASPNVTAPSGAVPLRQPQGEAQTRSADASSGAASSPTFDVVRVNPEGDAVIAGRAEPDTKVTVLDGDRVIGEVTADRRGEWVLVPEKPLPAGSRELSLRSENAAGDSRRSESVVILVVPERNRDIAGRETGQSTGALALQVPRRGVGPSDVLQRPSHPGDGAPRSGSLTIDSVDYDRNGELALSGRAGTGSDVVLYLDNKYIGQGRVAENGQWHVTPENQVAPGLYSLRADEVKSGGKVVARIEIPFSRSAVMNDLPPGEIVVVQPGNSLWRLARRSYGRGVQYTVIYQANRLQIRDPDLIYPGQIFSLPKIN